MSPPSSSINPSQAVERIREIIVGRHLERLEQRVVRLETGQALAPAAREAQDPQILSQWEDRLCTHEARLEALQHTIKKLSESTRDEGQLRNAQQREEIQRLAAQIQQVAAFKAEESGNAAVARLEGRIGTWLGTWQNSLQTHLNDRDKNLASQLRAEVATLWESTESQLTRLQSRAVDREQIEDRFTRIAAAALALAQAASPASPAAGPSQFPPFQVPASGTASPTP